MTDQLQRSTHDIFAPPAAESLLGEALPKSTNIKVKRQRLPWVSIAAAVASTGIFAYVYHLPDYAETHKPAESTTKIGERYCENAPHSMRSDMVNYVFPAQFRLCLTQTTTMVPVTLFDSIANEATAVEAEFIDIGSGENISVKNIEAKMGGSYDSDVRQLQTILLRAKTEGYLSDGVIQFVHSGNGSVDSVFEEVPDIFIVSPNGAEVAPLP